MNAEAQIDEEAMDALHGELEELLKKHNVIGALFSLHMGPYIAASWFPGCDDECPHPRICRAHNFRRVGKKLIEMANEIEEQEAEGGAVHSSMTISKQFLN